MHCLLFLAVGMISLANCLMAGSDVRNVNVKICRVCIVEVQSIHDPQLHFLCSLYKNLTGR
jgi:hypothetical protein